MSERYPNADTSAARLAHIQERWQKGYSVFGAVGDLLAMLDERQVAAHVNNTQLFSALQKVHELSNELHDQRWRRLSEQEPALAQVVQVYLPGREGEDEVPFMTICFGVIDTDEAWEWWRPETRPPGTAQTTAEEAGI